MFTLGKLGAMGGIARQTNAKRAISILRRFGTNAHAYIPGIGSISGLTAGNYTLSDGSTGATVVDGLNGRMLDAAGSVGPELVTNGDFSNGTTGWGAVASTLSAASGELTVTSTGATGRATASIALIVGRTYILTKTRTGGTSPNPSVNLFAMPGYSVNYATGVGVNNQVIFTATTALAELWLSASSTPGETAIFDNISLREVTGIHATADGAARPWLRRGAVNLLTYSQDFSNAAWAPSVNTTRTANYAAAPDGTITASRLQILLANQAAKQTAGLVNTDYRQSVWVKSATGLPVQYQFWEGNGYNTSVTGTATDTWVRVSARMKDSALARFDFGSTTAGADLLVWGAQLEIGSTASDYSPTTTAAASNPTAGRYSAEYATTQWMALGSVPFTQADDFSIHIAARCDSIAVSRTLYSHSNVSGHQVGYVYFNASGNVLFSAFDGTTTKTITSPSTYLLTPIVIRARKVGSTMTLWINGVQVGSIDCSAVTSPALTTATIGGFNGGTLTHVGQMGWCLPIKGTETDVDGLIIDRLVAQTFPNAPVF